MDDKCLVAIIPTFQAGKLLDDAIMSVKAASSISNLDVKVIVVDNSTNGDDQIYSTSADTYCHLFSNPGFGVAVNKGFEIAFEKYDFEWVLLLNPDAKLSEDFFAIMSQEKLILDGNCSNPIMPLICFDSPIYRIKPQYLIDHGIERINFVDPFDQFLVFDKVGKPLEFLDQGKKTLAKGDVLCIRNDKELPKQLIYLATSSSDERTDLNYELLQFDKECLVEDFLVQNAGSEIHSPFSAGDLLTGYLASLVKDHFGGPRRAWCGAGVLLPKTYIKTFGGFDPTFFLYYEDTELSHRALSSNRLPILLPRLQIFHKHSAITGQNNALRSKSIWQSRAIFVARTSGLQKAMLLGLATLARPIVSLVRKHTSIKHVIRNAFPEFFHTLFGISKSIFMRYGSKFK